MSKRVIAVLTMGALMLLGASSAQAAMKGETVTQQKTVGPYRLVLKIGPVEDMAMSGMSGERVLGGHMGTCHMAGSKAGKGMDSGVCNRHVELHVYAARTGKVVTRASVSIMLRDTGKRMSVTVPVMTMEDPHMGTADLHFGNNVHAGPGTYTVTVRVNAVTAVFHVQLM